MKFGIVDCGRKENAESEDERQLNKLMYWFLWGLTLVSINAFAIPLAFFSSEDSSAAGSLLILFLCNLASFQLFIAAMQKHQKGFSQGLIFAGLFVVAMFLIWQKIVVKLAVLLLVIAIIASAILLAMEIFKLVRGN